MEVSDTSSSDLQPESQSAEIDINLEESSSADVDDESGLNRRGDAKVSSIICYMFLDYLTPLLLCLSAYAITSLLGALLQIIVIIHFVAINKKGEGRLLRLSLGLASLVQFCVCIACLIGLGDPETTFINQLLGTSFTAPTAQKPAITGFISCAGTVVHISCLLIVREADLTEVRNIRQKVFKNVTTQYIINLSYMICLMVIGATNISYLFFPLMIYYWYANISLAVFGRVVLSSIIGTILHAYSLCYSIFEFCMASFAYMDGRPTGVLGYSTMRPGENESVTMVFSLILTVVSCEIITGPKWGDGMTTRVPRVMNFVTDFLIVAVFLCVFIFAVFYPCLVSVFWMMISFCASFCPFYIVKRLYFPFLSVAFCTSFIVLAVFQHTSFEQRPEDGVDNSAMFRCVFGMHKFTGMPGYTFEMLGYALMCLMGQIGQFKSKQQKSSRKQVEYIIPDVDNINVAKLRHQIHWTKIVLKLRLIRKIGEKFVILVPYCLLGGSFILSIVAGFDYTRYTFQIFAVLNFLMVSSMIYSPVLFAFIAFIAGIMIMISCYYTSFDVMNCYATNSCITYGVFSEMWNSGMAPLPGTNLYVYVWAILICYVFNVALMRMKNWSMKVPSVMWHAVTLGISVCQFCYALCWKSTVFSLVYFLLGIVGFVAHVLSIGWCRQVAYVLTSVSTAVEMACALLTHYHDTRNFLAAVIPPTVMDYSVPATCDGKMIALACMILFNSLSQKWKLANMITEVKRSVLWDVIVFEIVRIVRKFYFYICWILLFYFSISQEYPTLMKFVMLVAFHGGAMFARSMGKSKLGVLIFLVAYVMVQYVFDTFFKKDGTRFTDIIAYLGGYFSRNDANTAKLSPLLYQFAIILLSIVVFHPTQGKIPERNIKLMSIRRIYDGICAVLHYWIPAILESLLCWSALVNKTIFGWHSFVLTIISCTCPDWLAKWSIISILVINVCLLAQYLLYLGWPFCILDEPWTIFDLIPENYHDTAKDWLRFLGVYDVKVAALKANMLSSLAFTVYAEYSKLFVDYDAKFSELPQWIRGIVNYIVENAYEILIPIVIVCSSVIGSIDGVLFVVVAIVSFFCHVLYGYKRDTSLTLMNGFIIALIGLKVLSRIPIFDSEITRTAFDLPYAQTSMYGIFWIISFFLLRVCVCITKSDLYKQRQEYRAQHFAYKFIRERQLRVIDKLDQDILIAKRNTEITAITQTENFSLSDEVLPAADEQVTSISEEESNNLKRIIQCFYGRFVVPWLRKVIKVLCGTLPINDEAGMNVLTLESCTVLMKKNLHSLLNGRQMELEPREQEFLRGLPPSFTHQFTSLAHLRHFDDVKEDDLGSLLVRYLLLLSRNCSLIVLVIAAVAYMYNNPYIFAIVIMIFVANIFCSLDMRGYPNVYRSYMVFVALILFFRCCSRSDIMYRRLSVVTSTLEYVGNRFSLFAVIGLEPSLSLGYEIFLFLASVWFVLDRIASIRVFHPEHYFQQCKAAIPLFPEEHCYGIMNDPVKHLGLKAGKPSSFIEYLKNLMSRKGLRKTSHRTITLMLDLLSLVLILTMWSFWEAGMDYVSISKVSQSYVFRISGSMLTVLLVHVILTLGVFFCQLAQKYFVLMIINMLWMVYTLLMAFFYLPAKPPVLAPSLQFFILVRLISHFLVAHECYSGRVLVTFRYPKFAKKWRQIIFANKFMRTVPFVFELQSLMMWLIEPTKVSLSNFFLIRDVTMRVEILIAQQMSPKREIKEKPRIRRGFCWIFMFVCLVFVPLFLMIDSAGEEAPNKLLSMKLSIGFGEMPPLYSASAHIRVMRGTERKALVGTDDSVMRVVGSSDEDVAYVAELPLSSNELFQLSEAAKTRLHESLVNDTESISQSITIEMLFEQNTGASDARTLIFYAESGTPYEAAYRYIDIMHGNESVLPWNISLPRALFVTNDIDPYSYEIAETNCSLEYSPDSVWTIRLGDYSWLDLPGDNVTEYMYRIVVFSEKVDVGQQTTADQSGLIVVYIILLFIVGVVVRDRTLGQLDHLWLHRLDVPQNLYKLIMAIHLVRSAGDVEKEEELVDRFLDTMRSQEQVLSLTAKT